MLAVPVAPLAPVVVRPTGPKLWPAFVIAMLLSDVRFTAPLMRMAGAESVIAAVVPVEVRVVAPVPPSTIPEPSTIGPAVVTETVLPTPEFVAFWRVRPFGSLTTTFPDALKPTVE